jgi:molybdate transport system substrate-binding protein
MLIAFRAARFAGKPSFVIFYAVAFVLWLWAPLHAAEIKLFAAASLKDALNEISGDYAKTRPEVTFTKNYAASGALARQIENGAPADIFISANREWLEYLAVRKLVAEKSSGIFARNTLVFYGKPGLNISSLREIVTLEKIAIGSPKSVPAGGYALAAFKKAGIDGLLEKKLVMARDARECLMYAERGEVDGAFVYKTDALAGKGKGKILFAVSHNDYPPVTYPMTLTAAGAKKPEATAFYAALRSPEAQAVLRKHGFIVP